MYPNENAYLYNYKNYVITLILYFVNKQYIYKNNITYIELVEIMEVNVQEAINNFVCQEYTIDDTIDNKSLTFYIDKYLSVPYCMIFFRDVIESQNKRIIGKGVYVYDYTFRTPQIFNTSNITMNNDRNLFFSEENIKIKSYRIERERIEQERIEQERIEQERIERERIEQLHIQHKSECLIL